MNSLRGLLCLVLPALLILFVLAGCQQQKADNSERMNEINNKIYEIWNTGNVAELDAILDSNFIYHKNDSPPIKGLDAMKKEITDTRTMLPDLKLVSEDRVFSENKMASRWHLTGTNTGPYGGMPPTGKSIDIWGNAIVHIENGKMIEEWNAYNNQASMEQLGFKLVPPSTEDMK